jgi:hypothetical protein
MGLFKKKKLQIPAGTKEIEVFESWTVQWYVPSEGLGLVKKTKLVPTAEDARELQLAIHNACNLLGIGSRVKYYENG